MVEPSRKKFALSSKIEFVDHYPEDNPKMALEDISDCLAYLGVFDGFRTDPV